VDMQKEEGGDEKSLATIDKPGVRVAYGCQEDNRTRHAHTHTSTILPSLVLAVQHKQTSGRRSQITDGWELYI
jgi:hypothetical protein